MAGATRPAPLDITTYPPTTVAFAVKPVSPALSQPHTAPVATRPAVCPTCKEVPASLPATAATWPSTTLALPARTLAKPALALRPSAPAARQGTSTEPLAWLPALQTPS